MAAELIGEKLRKLRAKTGLSQQKLAVQLGVHWRSIQNWETDTHAVDAFKAQAILERVRAIADASKDRKGSN